MARPSSPAIAASCPTFSSTDRRDSHFFKIGKSRVIRTCDRILGLGTGSWLDARAHIQKTSSAYCRLSGEFLGRVRSSAACVMRCEIGEWVDGPTRVAGPSPSGRGASSAPRQVPLNRWSRTRRPIRRDVPTSSWRSPQCVCQSGTCSPERFRECCREIRERTPEGSCAPETRRRLPLG